MDTNKHEFEEAGERPTEVEVRTQVPSSRFPQRHDPAFSAPAHAHARARDRSGNRLIVRKETGLFVLREFANGHGEVVVKAIDAQMIQDYLNANWPVGTTAQWIILPPFKRIETEKRRIGETASWLKKIPVGAHL